MDLTQRKEQVLKAVVEGYIASGEPVGSKTLQNDLFSDVSSATIRNDMADLTVKGYLSQPHTSAGRVPSQKGYRYYVERLMSRNKLSPRITEYIEEKLIQSADTPENILKKTTQVLSEVTGVASIASTPSGEGARVHKVRFVQTGRQTAMAVLICSTGMVKTKLFRCDFVITSEALNIFDKALNSLLSGMELARITQPFIQTVAASFGEMALYMPSVLIAVMEASKEALKSEITVSGQTNILSLPDISVNAAAQMLRFLSSKREIASLLCEKPNGTAVYIGEETGRQELYQSSVIITHYEISGQTAGEIALLGSVRMDYKNCIGCLEYTADIAGQLIEQLVAS